MSKNIKLNRVIRNYLEQYQKWGNILGVNDSSIDKNTVWHQCIEMIESHIMFSGLNKAGYLTSQRQDSTKYLSSNMNLAKFLWEGYIAFQCLAIRRLVDNDYSKNYSLNVLLKSLEENSHLITREVFVCSQGHPYEYEEELGLNESLRMERAFDNKIALWGEGKTDAEHSRNRHEIFDRLSGVKDKSCRKKTDSIHPSYWCSLKDKINIPEIMEIVNYSNNYIAHAGNKKKLEKLSDEDKKISIMKIQSCHFAILEVFHQLTSDFWFDTKVVSLGDSGNIFYMDKPFTDSETLKTVRQYLSEKEQEYLRVQGIDLR